MLCAEVSSLVNEKWEESQRKGLLCQSHLTHLYPSTHTVLSRQDPPPPPPSRWTAPTPNTEGGEVHLLATLRSSSSSSNRRLEVEEEEEEGEGCMARRQEEGRTGRI